jgi:hypothetical protein
LIDGVRADSVEVIPQHAFDGASRDNGKPGVALALDGLVDGSDGGSGSDVEGGAGEEVKEGHKNDEG